MSEQFNNYPEVPTGHYLAEDILDQVALLALFTGDPKKINRSQNIGPFLLPAIVHKHLPEPSTEAMIGSPLLSVEQYMDPRSGNPILNGDVAIIKFARSQYVNHEELRTSVNYLIRGAEGAYSIARRSLTERLSTDPQRSKSRLIEEFLVNGQPLRPIEEEIAKRNNSTEELARLGFEQVSNLEAQQILGFLTDLNNSTISKSTNYF
jgi:hypothetical protein